MEDGCGRVVGEKTVLTLVEGKARERFVEETPLSR
jgi:hypothetical protein